MGHQSVNVLHIREICLKLLYEALYVFIFKIKLTSIVRWNDVLSQKTPPDLLILKDKPISQNHVPIIVLYQFKTKQVMI